MRCHRFIQRIACLFSQRLLLPETRTPLQSFSPSVFAFMSSSTNGPHVNSTHLDRTEGSERQEIVTEATVSEITQLSPSVKGLRLKVEDRGFTFKPGQWVDFFIPGLSTVGGFSICSSPKDLHEKSIIELGVKYSEHPPAFWIHNKCHVGSKVHMRVGGNFYYDPMLGVDQIPDLLLIAGGVGVNPLYSIVRHVADICSEPQSQNQYTGKIALLFSAKNTDELLFKDSLLEFSHSFPSISCQFFTTNYKLEEKTPADNKQNVQGRISHSTIQEAISGLDRSNFTCFICGPPPMIQDVTDILRKLEIAEHRIHFEKWW